VTTGRAPAPVPSPTPTPPVASDPVAGWYADPWRLAPWRWWDGVQWTPHLYGPYYPHLYPHLYPAWHAAPPERAPRGPGIKGGGIAAVGAGAGVVGTVGVAIGFAARGGLDVRDPWFLLISQLALWAGFLGAVLVASHRHGTGSLRRDFGLAWPRWSDVVTGVGGGLVGRTLPILIAILVVLAGNGFGSPNSTARRVVGFNPEGVTGWIVLTSLLVVGAPFVEELFFRGLIQGAFTRRVGAVSAIFVTAVIFSFAHITSEGPFAPLVLFPAALVLGYLRYRSGRLAPGMVAHSVFNGLAFALLAIPAFR